MSMIMSPVDAIAELFASEGAADYLGEPVTVAAHLLQAGALAAGGGRTARARRGGAAARRRPPARRRRPGGRDRAERARADGRDRQQPRRPRRGMARAVVPRVGHRAGPAARRGEAVPVRDRAVVLRAAVGGVGLHAVGAGRPDDRRGGARVRARAARRRRDRRPPLGRPGQGPVRRRAGLRSLPSPAGVPAHAAYAEAGRPPLFRSVRVAADLVPLPPTRKSRSHPVSACWTCSV